jgi:integrase/recombinase XerD
MGVKNGGPDDYIFPIINPKLDGLKNENKRMGFQGNHNRMLNAIGKKLEFDVDLCFNHSRHSFATMLKLNKTPVAFISQAMGHASTTTTQHYLKSIQDENYKDISESLLKF